MAMRGPRHPIGAAPWIVEERTTALHIAQSEIEEFMFSAKNELDWLNEHMADVFSENQINVADIFKTPGKLRGKTPRTARKINKGDIRAGAPNPFAISKLTSFQQQQKRQSPTFIVADDKLARSRKSQSPKRVVPAKRAAAPKLAPVVKPTQPAPVLNDSLYYGNRSQKMVIDGDDEEDELAVRDTITQPFSHPARPATSETFTRQPNVFKVAEKRMSAATKTSESQTTAFIKSPEAGTETSPSALAVHASPTQPTTKPTFHLAKEEQTAVVPLAIPGAFKSSSPATDTKILSSSPFCPVHSHSSVAVATFSSPSKIMAPASPKIDHPAAPSSPLQSTTPACPPPHELLPTMPIPHISAAVSPALDQKSVAAAATIPQVVAVPIFADEKRTDVAGDWEVLDAGKEATVCEDETVVVDATNCHDHTHQTLLQPRQDSETEMQVEEEETPSSPVRPVVRKSSMSFASLPARAPFTSNKSLGAGTALARTGQAETARTSYFNRPTGGKSLGNVRTSEPEEDDHQDQPMNGDGHNTALADQDFEVRNKTYAQRLHDRISMLGKSQANGPRPSKSLAAFAQLQEAHHTTQQKTQQSTSHSPKKTAAPGALFGDEEDDEDEDEDGGNWIDPLPVVAATPMANVKTITTAAAYAAKEITESTLSKQRHQFISRPESPRKALAPVIPERTTSVVTVPVKSSSVPSLPTSDPAALVTAKLVAVSNPANSVHAALTAASDHKGRPPSPSKSPSRNYRDSPLKHVKNKLSSILKTSRGLLASSAALSAEGKSLLLSPSTTRFGPITAPSAEILALKHSNNSVPESAPSESARQPSVVSTVSTVLSLAASSSIANTQKSPARAISPVRTNRKTRASVEREYREQKRREQELKEVQRMAEQMDKLEALREKEREKARVFAESQEKIMAATTKPADVSAQRDLRGNVQSQKETGGEEDDDMHMLYPPPPSMPKPQSSSPIRAATKPARISPRKVKVQQPDGDSKMMGVPGTSMPPPPLPAQSIVSTASAVPRSAQATRTIRRPIKPTKDAPAKPKQAPTVIRVTTSSSQHQQQQSQLHPSNSILAASLHETLVGPPQLKNKTSTASLHTKPSLPSLKSSVSSTGRPKALELAAKRKEAEEKEAQRKRDAKAEMERKRAIVQEQDERRQEQQRKKEREREQVQAEAASTRKAAAAAAAQRQATAEKAKQTRAPAPVQRTQLPNGTSGDYNRSDAQPPRPQSRLATTSGLTMYRSQEEEHRPVNAVLSHTAKALSKRPLPAAETYESQNTDRPGTKGSGQASGGSNMPSYQHKDAKRIRMSEEFDEDELEVGGHDVRVSSIKGPPVRPSNGFKKELPSKSVFGNGYSTAASNASRDLFKSTVTAQHSNQSRAGHPMDMAQVSKATISFAPSGANSAASAAAAAAAALTSATHNAHKTPLRPAGTQLAGKSAAKSAVKSIGKPTAKSSPRYPNGDAIELPDIQTDDEDSEEEHVNAAPWADSPDLRRALMRQETVDPFAVFGPPGPLNMEEVFNKTKERWHKYRARTSSANWSGIDRLTDDDIRKDLAARDKIRREGGWSYELGKDML
ncbi:hypothetical protein SEPCBS57363_003585 [Sporothrix epigloea]|uniref:Inner centromere protein ARK-binding domain-containing protein n=1 Tax=Sporothrix epigloea TaxID=1892477 RepID=A0ABP0DQX6_9PEZI